MEISSSKSEITTSRIHNELKIIGNLVPVNNVSATASSIYILNFKTDSFVNKEISFQINYNPYISPRDVREAPRKDFRCSTGILP